MRRELSSAYRKAENMAQALVTRVIHYYTKETPLNTFVVHAAIKIIVLLGAILVSLRYPLRRCCEIPYSSQSGTGHGIKASRTGICL